MLRKRTRKLMTLTVAALLLALAAIKWGGPAAERLLASGAVEKLIGPTAATIEAQEALDREVAEIGRLIRAQQDGEAPAQTDPLAWPAPWYYSTTSEFGTRVHPVLHVPKVHTGIDIGAPKGSPAVACLGGRVVLVQEFAAYGQVVAIDHGGGLSSVYAHLSAVDVAVGDLVEQGAQVGLVGATGAVTGPHLHFELRQDGEPFDPTSLLGAR